MEVFGFIVYDVLLTGFGWMCLHVWYRDRKKVKKILDEKYAGEYGAAGQIFILNFIAGAGAITMLGLLIFFLISLLYRASTD